MSIQTFSRSFLQNIPEQRKQQVIDGHIQEFINELQEAAAAGKTKYIYNPNTRRLFQTKPPLPVVTNDELVSAFQKKFPGCDVLYEETWVDLDSNNRFLKKGIVIDWS